jgi:hypothetical protein
MAYTCERCGYETTNKSNIARHLKSKVPCDVTKRDIEREELLLRLFDREYKTERASCPICKKVCSKCQLARHKKLCLSKQKHQEEQTTTSTPHSYPEVTKEEFLKLKAELEQLKQQIQNSQA